MNFALPLGKMPENAVKIIDLTLFISFKMNNIKKKNCKTKLYNQTPFQVKNLGISPVTGKLR